MMSGKLRLAFMGTPDFAVPALKALHAAKHDIVAVYSQPPRRAGRGKKLTPSPVQKVAEELGPEVRTPVSLKDETSQAEFAALNLDAAVVAAYGLILTQAIATSCVSNAKKTLFSQVFHISSPLPKYVLQCAINHSLNNTTFVRRF